VSRRILSFLVIASLGLGGCGALHREPEASPPLVVVLFDVSGSTNDPAVRARYLDAFERVVEHVVAANGTIVGDVIDDDPLAHSTFPIDATFEACDAFTDNRLVCDTRATRTREDLVTQARGILARTPADSGTDIHDGLLLAQRVFDSYPEAGARSLVLLSDMVERSPALNVARPGFDDDAIEPTLEALAADGAIPDLHGVSAYVIGAGTLADSALPAERFLTIQRFWQAYLSRAGADVPPARYGAALVRFP
jgi:hypothetical protein